MATVVNDMTIEPAAAPPAAEPPSKEGGEKGGETPSPDMERQIDRVTRRKKQRVMRLWAH